MTLLSGCPACDLATSVSGLMCHGAAAALHMAGTQASPCKDLLWRQARAMRSASERSAPQLTCSCSCVAYELQHSDFRVQNHVTYCRQRTWLHDNAWAWQMPCDSQRRSLHHNMFRACPSPWKETSLDAPIRRQLHALSQAPLVHAVLPLYLQNHPCLCNKPPEGHFPCQASSLNVVAEQSSLFSPCCT